MNTYNLAFVTAGGIGSIVAIVHGVLTQQFMVKPILTETEYAKSIGRLIPLLLQFSTFCWFFGGVALMTVPFFLDTSVVLTTAAFVGTCYAYGAVGNFWSTNGRHPGWVLLAIAVALIVYASIAATR